MERGVRKPRANRARVTISFRAGAGPMSPSIAANLGAMPHLGYARLESDLLIGPESAAALKARPVESYVPGARLRRSPEEGTAVAACIQPVDSVAFIGYAVSGCFLAGLQKAGYGRIGVFPHRAVELIYGSAVGMPDTDRVLLTGHVNFRKTGDLTGGGEAILGVTGARAGAIGGRRSRIAGIAARGGQDASRGQQSDYYQRISAHKGILPPAVPPEL